MEEKRCRLKDIVHKDIGKVCKKYARNERLYKHNISQMEKKLCHHLNTNL
jgi:hypothetical protein